MRVEEDFLGVLEIADDALYGIHSLRARDNFPESTAFFLEWYKALGITKLSCFETYRNYKKNLLNKYKKEDIPFNLIEDNIIDALINSAEEVSNGKHYEWFIVPAIQGGAGTSINMNINEIITNNALLKLNEKPGKYSVIDPIEHANIYQSTNDVVPTSLKVAIIRLLSELEEQINNLRNTIEKIEKEHFNTIRIGYTQMQEAVPTSFSRLFSTYSDALSRDWWRVSKCFERIKYVNLGGSAIGTGITVPQFFIMEAVRTLQKNTGLTLTRSENLSDATSNHDSLVEVHATMKAHAVNLEKMVNDIRLLASDLTNKEIAIPKKQAGSSIMPGKVNPVIVEFVVSAAHRIYANDTLISNLCAQGCLELNAYLPVIGHAFIESLKLLIAADKTLEKNLMSGLVIFSDISRDRLLRSASITTILIPYIGYNKATELAHYMQNNKLNIFEANEKLKLISKEKLEELIKPENILKEGFTLNDFK